MIENREMAAFAKALWENYIKFRNKEADVSNVSYYKAQVTAKPGGGVLTIKRPFDTTAYNVSAPSYMDDIEIGGQVLVLRFGNDNNLKNHFIIDNAARTMLASAIATGSSITFPISIANGGTGATTLAGAKTNLGIPNASDTNPNMDGTASAGTQTTYSRGDHTHPADTSKADKATTVTNVLYDSATGNITQTINGTTSNVTPVVTGVNLNGTDTATPSFYAPTTAGTSGYVLTSNGSGAPTWQAVSGGSSAAYAVCNTQDDYELIATTTSSGTFELTTGAIVFVSFTYARPTYYESSNLTLNVDSTGNKTIRFANTSLDATVVVSPITWTAGEVVEFVYDGTYWQMVGKYKAASTTSYGVTILSSAVNSTDTGAAATSAAVKAAYDLANGKSAVTLNGTASASPSFYAPLGSGSAGSVLKSGGANNAPYWGSVDLQYEQCLITFDDGDVYMNMSYAQLQYAIEHGKFVYGASAGDFTGKTFIIAYYDFTNEGVIAFSEVEGDWQTRSIYSNIIKIDSEDNVTWDTFNPYIPNIVYATSSSQNTAQLTATVADAGWFELTTGARVAVKFTYAKPSIAQSALTLNVNSTGAKTIVCNNNGMLGGQNVYTWGAGDIVEFLYDGTAWQMLAKPRVASTSEYGVVQLSTATNSTSNNTAATSSAVKAAYDLANSRSYALSMSGNVITLTGQDGNVTSVTLPVWDGSYT